MYGEFILLVVRIIYMMAVNPKKLRAEGRVITTTKTGVTGGLAFTLYGFIFSVGSFHYAPGKTWWIAKVNRVDARNRGPEVYMRASTRLARVNGNGLRGSLKGPGHAVAYA